ncbi:DUF2795 domain-containing protein [Streptomyces sp. NPDC059153]|uniref:DUF2795 domain-containing protein n=1 Tax=Streptomyces sp. NPDC059153 TaxID=3346743 RepID=UPI0036A81E4C
MVAEADVARALPAPAVEDLLEALSNDRPGGCTPDRQGGVPTMERGSSRLSPHEDDQRKHELQGFLRSGHTTHASEAYDPEPPADDDVHVDPGGPVPPPGEERQRARAEAEAEELRAELARRLSRAVFPADRASLLRALSGSYAPDALMDAVRDLPADDRYANAGEITRALGYRPRV